MSITLNKGRGYVQADRNKQYASGIIGEIPVDSIYTPVVKVNYTVDNMRVGQITDYRSASRWRSGPTARLRPKPR